MSLLFHKYSKHSRTSESLYKLFPLPGNIISQKTTWLALSVPSDVCSRVTFSMGPTLKTFIQNCISLCIALSCFVFLILYNLLLSWSIPHTHTWSRNLFLLCSLLYPQYQEKWLVHSRSSIKFVASMCEFPLALMVLGLAFFISEDQNSVGRLEWRIQHWLALALQWELLEIDLLTIYAREIKDTSRLIDLSLGA